MRALAIIAVFIAACEKDETLTGYGAAEVTWVLEEMNGQEISTRITLSFPEEGRFSGKAPCNRYFGGQTAPYPWFAVDGVASTKVACSELTLEGAYFKTFRAMEFAEVAGQTLLLSNEQGQELLYRAEN